MTAHWRRNAGKVVLLQSGNTFSAGVCKEGDTCRVPGATALKTDGTSHELVPWETCEENWSECEATSCQPCLRHSGVTAGAGSLLG